MKRTPWQPEQQVQMLSYSIKENKFELFNMQIKKNSPITSIAVKDKVIAYSYEEGSIILI